MEGKVKIYLKKKGAYTWKQAVIYVSSKYLEEVEPFDGKVIEFTLGSSREKQLLNLLSKLFALVFNDKELGRKILSKYKELVTEILGLLEAEK